MTWSEAAPYIGGMGGAGLLLFTPGAFFGIRKILRIRELKNESLNQEKIQDLVNQILSVLANRNVVMELRDRVQNGQGDLTKII